MPLSRILNSLIVPLILFACGFWLIYNDDVLPLIVVPILVYLPFAAAFIILLITYQFNLFRLFTLTCLMAAWYFLTDFQSADSQLLSNDLQQWLIWLLPVLLVILSWLPERGILTIFGVLSWIVLGAIIGASYYWSQSEHYAWIINSEVKLTQNSAIFVLAILATTVLHQAYKIWRGETVLDGILLFILLAIGW